MAIDRKVLAKAIKKQLAMNADSGDINSMVNGYLVAALWSSTDEDENPLDDNYNVSDIANESKQKAKKDCADFLHKIKQEWLEEMDMETVGHKFWLNRNGHGTGFWDADEIQDDDNRKALDKVAKGFGEVYCYVGDDGKVYMD